MIKAIVVGVLAFAISLGGTTFVVVKRAPVPVADSSARTPAHPADSAAAPHAAADTSHGDSSAHPQAPAAGRPDAAPAPGPAPVHAAAAAQSRPAPPAKPPLDPAAKAAAVKQVARVLSAMKAPEAAKVLAYLTDTEVEEILRAVGPRQAADFLTNLPKERAAQLSRRLLVPQPAEATR